MSVPATGYRDVEVEVPDGSLVIRGGEHQSVRVRVNLEEGCGDVAQHRLHVGRSGSVMRLAVEPSTKDVCDERWTVEVPWHFGVSGELDRAEVVVDGLAGGVDVDLGNGVLRVEVPGGDVRARIQKGDVIVRTRSKSVGPVSMTSEVGNVDLVIDGGSVRGGSSPGPGHRVEYAGLGRDRISLETIVGDIRLEVR
jgi:hypothetical protein